ncbi:sulfotransferase family protein [Mangrovihabitans endophyticus]|uniref:Sulfotransferase family protein n=1 Tax=Mangrovihabitans endophyticus TaxID=1751298 RepID=A0A8J3FSA2_9ACTN|nr:sulfotransferase family protein [Mangrovihabitans endophyticus]GGL13318.1 sulfotransferase family protein [Mangrovihabitans endophyticus]
MDIIGAGFGRTGTLSLKAALEHLGFGPCLHMLPLFDEPKRAALLADAAGGHMGSLEAAVAGYRSTVDWPGTYFWRELVARNPGAKVILTVRDPEKWYESAHRTIYQAATNPPDSSTGSPETAVLMRMVHATVWDGTFQGRFADRDHAIATMREHNDAVRREIPADRLLEYPVGAGWEPLCAFLGVDVPAEPFPKLNDSAAFAERIAEARRDGKL